MSIKEIEAGLNSIYCQLSGQRILSYYICNFGANYQNKTGSTLCKLTYAKNY
jgi:hypothetical protein